MGTIASDWCWGTGPADFQDLKAWLKEQAAQMSAQMSAGRAGRGGHARASGPAWGHGWQAWWGAPPGRPRASKGNVRLAILALLRDGPRHGYQVIQDIAERSHGAWTPSAGSVYPTLSALQDEGLIDDEKQEGRRVFALTEQGAAYASEHAAEIDAVFDEFSEHDRASVDDLRTLMVGVGAAAMQVIASGRTADAQRILNRARRDLFAVLAEDEDEG
jgi:DNA-binding PadR family transcriptional regulator